MSLHCFTYYTDAEEAKWLLESGKLHGLEFKNLAKTTEWKGLEDKFHGVKGALKELPSGDIVCFVDAYDVLINCDKDKLLKVFEESKCALFFGAEFDLVPNVFDHELFPKSPSAIRFINSGVYIGYVGTILEMLEYGDYRGLNDQEHANRYFLEKGQEKNIRLDYHNTLALNMHGVNWQMISVSNGDISYDLNGAVPCFVHFNGHSYQDVEHDMPKHEFKASCYLPNTLLEALTKAKELTNRFNMAITLTGRGHTYEL